MENLAYRIPEEYIFYEFAVYVVRRAILFNPTSKFQQSGPIFTPSKMNRELYRGIPMLPSLI